MLTPPEVLQVLALVREREMIASQANQQIAEINASTNELAVPYEEDPNNGKDRPVLVVGRDKRTLLGLMLSSNPRRADDPDWIGIGSGSWDHEGRPSWVRLDRVLDVPEDGIRREGAIVARKTFDLVAHRLVAEYRWS